ncbi:MAG: DUF3570 domain-containing protein [Myxococcota bacterium]
MCFALFCTDTRTGADDNVLREASERERWRVEESRVRFVYYDQKGFGFQSQAGPGPRGSERLYVYEPMLYVRVRQNKKVQHSVTLPVDIITSASTDSIDALTSASRTNEAGTLQFDSEIKPTDDDTVKVTYGGHGEEWFGSVFAGIGYTRELAQDNATVMVRIDGNFDWFKAYGPWPGAVFPDGDNYDHRGAFGGSVEMSQILNPRTYVKAGYGATWQKGDLATPWNSVPIFCDPELTTCLARIREKFPETRLRQTLSGLLAHYVPRSETTLRLSYRFYWDDYEVLAHTLLAEVYQNIRDRALLKAHYRMHQQSAVFFWTSNLGIFDIDPNAPRTADSDLARFWANEWGVKLLFHVSPPGRPHQHDIDVYYNRYTRTNDLTVDVVSIGYGYNF